MKPRVLCLTPHDLDEKQGRYIYRLSNPELAKNILPPNEELTRYKLDTHVKGLTITAVSLGVDFVILCPPRAHMNTIENSFAKEGVVVVYEDFYVGENGRLQKLGYHLACKLPDPDANANLHDDYERWLANNLSNLSEKDLAKVYDPWRTYLNNVLLDLTSPVRH